MAKLWFDIPPEFPIDGQQVWVRRYNLWTSFLAEWDATAAEFVTLEGYRMPWYLAGKWKVYVE